MINPRPRPLAKLRIRSARLNLLAARPLLGSTALAPEAEGFGDAQIHRDLSRATAIISRHQLLAGRRIGIEAAVRGIDQGRITRASGESRDGH